MKLEVLNMFVCIYYIQWKLFKGLQDQIFCFLSQFHFEQEKAVFFVQEKQEANAIRSQDKKIQLPNGFKVL